MTSWRVGYLIGSIAKESINRKLAGALVKLAPKDLVLSEVPIADLPLYSYDYDADYPPAQAAERRKNVARGASPGSIGPTRHEPRSGEGSACSAAPRLDPSSIGLPRLTPRATFFRRSAA